MSLMGGTDLGVTVDANVSPYERNIDRAKRATNTYERSLESLDADIKRLEKSLADEADKALKNHHDALEKTGQAAVVFGALSAAAFALAANEAIKWESAWAGVSKTVNGNADEMGMLEDQLRDLAKVLPASHQEIAAVAEAAGQLGVQRENIAGFTKVMLDLGNTTNLSADDAATSLAQLMNVMQSAPDLVDELGNTLVALGNKGASTESDILALAQRLAGVGQTVGASEADVLGLGSALANLGIQAELGGGATQRVLLTLYTAMQNGGDQAEKFAAISGKSADQFAAKWSTDPIKAFDLFIKGLGRIQESGGNVVSVLQDVGIKGTQNLQVLLRLAGSGDVLSKSLDDSAKAWDKNNALVKEAEKRYATTESQIQMARNEMVDAAIDIGAVVLPVIAGMVDTGSDLLRTWSDLPGPVKLVITILGLAATAIALLGGAALIAIPKIAAFRAAVLALNAGAMRSAGLATLGLSRMLIGPFGAALAVATIGVALFAAKHGAAARDVDALTATLDEQTGALTDNSREWAIRKLSDSGALDAAKLLGINLGLLTDAALGGADAQAKLDGELTRLQGTLGNTGPDRVKVAAMADLQRILDSTNGTLDKSREKWELENEAKAGSTAGTDQAADSMSKLPPILDDTADSAGDAAEEIKSLGDELTELSDNFFANRDAGRAVRDTMREIRKATRDYIKDHKDLDGAFQAGTKSGDEFAGLLDQLAQNYLDQITATEELTGSQKKTMAVYRDSRARLIEVATQLGLTKKEAEKYADAVLGTPAEAKTHFIQQGLDQAQHDVDAYAAAFGNIPKEVVTRFYTIHEDKLENGGHSPTPPSHGAGGNKGGGGKPATRGLPSSIWTAANAGNRQRSFGSAGGRPAGDSGGLSGLEPIDYDRLAAMIGSGAPFIQHASFESPGDYERAKRDHSRRSGAGGR